ncbi:hypothetical protein PF005_g22574 [Phytophthora fragariae]|uniref:Uncharacterized protein n=2 Tax=Phytophthora TaxID=4783 RepID=A0A6A3QRE0_9STRA|nr:hypothetical protein PF003_g31398 [Phytophthora fragariae]KAE9352172.1 hypothetical protein PR003_g4512 [Phytophthora rubi]KAE9081631.1 hypothetical protein PF007_g22584 [Phytophthora fragariae]KAE9082196.1 hypothetical protein PF010_g21688 [Phytophthora fragariae]KAE9104982.1 hypothetical protein PF006_g21763 [Phytophthora fragariae]
MNNVCDTSLIVMAEMEVTEEALCMHVATYMALKKSTVKMTDSGTRSSLCMVHHVFDEHLEYRKE